MKLFKKIFILILFIIFSINSTFLFADETTDKLNKQIEADKVKMDKIKQKLQILSDVLGWLSNRINHNINRWMEIQNYLSFAINLTRNNAWDILKKAVSTAQDAQKKKETAEQNYYSYLISSTATDKQISNALSIFQKAEKYAEYTFSLLPAAKEKAIEKSKQAKVNPWAWSKKSSSSTSWETTTVTSSNCNGDTCTTKTTDWSTYVNQF